MKNILLTLILLHVVFFSFSQATTANATPTSELEYEVNIVYPPLSMSKAELEDAHTIADLHPHYRPSWIQEFISVEVLVSHQGKLQKAISKNDTLTEIQKNLMSGNDIGTGIEVKIQYIPENTLIGNEPKEFDFTFTVQPEKEAKYPGGMQALRNYLQEKAINEIPKGSFKGYDLAAIKFTISEEGEILNANIFDEIYRKTKDEEVDAFLLKKIRTMPCWQPAEYANGTKTKQEFVLTVGNHKSCMLNILNIHRD